jgi:hypothetical protein
VRLGATLEVVALYSTRKTAAFARANNVNTLTNRKDRNFHLSPSSTSGFFDPKFTQITQRGTLLRLRCPNSPPVRRFGFHFIKTQLHGGVPVIFGRANLGNITRPSFDEGYRNCRTGFIENLGHADFLTDQPFYHISVFSF